MDANLHGGDSGEEMPEQEVCDDKSTVTDAEATEDDEVSEDKPEIEKAGDELATPPRDDSETVDQDAAKGVTEASENRHEPVLAKEVAEDADASSGESNAEDDKANAIEENVAEDDRMDEDVTEETAETCEDHPKSLEDDSRERKAASSDDRMKEDVVEEAAETCDDHPNAVESDSMEEKASSSDNRMKEDELEEAAETCEDHPHAVEDDSMEEKAASSDDRMEDDAIEEAAETSKDHPVAVEAETAVQECEDKADSDNSEEASQDMTSEAEENAAEDDSMKEDVMEVAAETCEGRPNAVEDDSMEEKVASADDRMEEDAMEEAAETSKDHPVAVEAETVVQECEDKTHSDDLEEASQDMTSKAEENPMTEEKLEKGSETLEDDTKVDKELAIGPSEGDSMKDDAMEAAEASEDCRGSVIEEIAVQEPTETSEEVSVDGQGKVAEQPSDENDEASEDKIQAAQEQQREEDVGDEDQQQRDDELEASKAEVNASEAKSDADEEDAAEQAKIVEQKKAEDASEDASEDVSMKEDALEEAAETSKDHDNAEQDEMARQEPSETCEDKTLADKAGDDDDDLKEASQDMTSNMEEITLEEVAEASDDNAEKVEDKAAEEAQRDGDMEEDAMEEVAETSSRHPQAVEEEIAGQEPVDACEDKAQADAAADASSDLEQVSQDMPSKAEENVSENTMKEDAMEEATETSKVHLSTAEEEIAAQWKRLQEPEEKIQDLIQDLQLRDEDADASDLEEASQDGENAADEVKDASDDKSEVALKELEKGSETVMASVAGRIQKWVQGFGRHLAGAEARPMEVAAAVGVKKAAADEKDVAEEELGGFCREAPQEGGEVTETIQTEALADNAVASEGGSPKPLEEEALVGESPVSEPEAAPDAVAEDVSEEREKLERSPKGKFLLRLLAGAPTGTNEESETMEPLQDSPNEMPEEEEIADNVGAPTENQDDVEEDEGLAGRLRKRRKQHGSAVVVKDGAVVLMQGDAPTEEQGTCPATALDSPSESDGPPNPQSQDPPSGLVTVPLAVLAEQQLMDSPPHSSDPHSSDSPARPCRVRMRPLETWRNEQVVYERLPGSSQPSVVAVVRHDEAATPASSKQSGRRGRGSKAGAEAAENTFDEMTCKRAAAVPASSNKGASKKQRKGGNTEEAVANVETSWIDDMATAGAAAGFSKSRCSKSKRTPVSRGSYEPPNKKSRVSELAPLALPASNKGGKSRVPSKPASQTRPSAVASPCRVRKGATKDTAYQQAAKRSQPARAQVAPPRQAAPVSRPAPMGILAMMEAQRKLAR